MSVDILQPQTIAEQKLLAAVQDGLQLRLGENRPSVPADDVNIRACFLRDLCIHPLDYRVDPRGVNIQGAYILCSNEDETGVGFRGRLDLEAVRFDYPIKLRKCTLPGVVNVSGAHFNRFSVEHSLIQGFWGGKLRVEGSLIFSHATIKQSVSDPHPRSTRPNGSTGQLILNGARIAGDLDCGALDIEDWTELQPAIDARNARIKGNIYLNSGFHARGAVHFGRASASGSIYCDGATLDPRPPGLGRDANVNSGQASVEARDREFMHETVLRVHSALILDQCTIGGSVMFCVGFRAHGEIRMVGATIAGRLRCDDAWFENSGWRSDKGPALIAKAAQISGQLDFNFVAARGALNFAGAVIGQSARFRYTNVQSAVGPALIFNNATIQGDLYFGKDFNEGETLARLAEPSESRYLGLFNETADVKVNWFEFYNFFVGGLVMSYATVRGRLSLLQARVGLSSKDVRANLDERRAHAAEAKASNYLPPDDLQAFQMYSAEIGGSCLLRGCLFIGETNLYGSRISTNLELEGSTCLNPFGHALVLQNTQVGGHADLSSDLTDRRAHRKAEVRPAAQWNVARIFASLPFPNASRLRSRASDTGAKIEGGRRFVCHGKLRAADITVGSRFSLDGAVLRNYFVDPEDQSEALWNGEISTWSEIGLGSTDVAPQNPPPIGHDHTPRPICLELVRAQIKGGLELTGFHHGPIGDIDLRDAHVGYLDDDEDCKPKRGHGRILIDGFYYRGLGYHSPKKATSRIEWLSKQWDGGSAKELFRAQPYEHLTSVLLTLGHEEDAYKIAVEERRNLRRFGGKARSARFADLVYDTTLRYGYFPARAVVVALVFVVIGSIFIYSVANPTCWEPVAGKTVGRFPPLPLFAVEYAAEAFVPTPDISDLGSLAVKSDWRLTGTDGNGRGACPQANVLALFLLFYRFIGWVFAALIVGTLTFWAVRRERKTLSSE